jgi:hypothetical protein
MIEFLSGQDSIVLMDIVDRLLFGPKDIPFFRVLSPGIATILEGFLDADSNLCFVPNV